MAIYSLSLRSIGRSTHRAGTAGAHVAYVTRASACRAVVAENMPAPPIGAKGGEARAWLDDQEQADRKNARVADRIMLALPVELDAAARVELVRAFVRDLTGGVAIPYLAAFHDLAGDADNPHCHLLLRDRGVETGRRVIGLSERGAVDRVRLAWEKATNAALEAQGSAARIDRRSLLAQGVRREPARHEGPAARRIAAKGGRSTKLRRIEKGMKPRRKAMHAAKRDREAREAREAKAAAREAHRAAQEAVRAEKARQGAERAAERRRATLEAREARKAGRVAKKAEKALRDAQIAAERQEADRVRKIEATVARSRTRVLRARTLRNTMTGFFHHLRQGTAMFDPFSQDQLGRATRSLLARAGELLAAWQAFRDGRHDGDFREAERGFTEAGTDLCEMHMVLAPPRRLSGAELADEQGRMARLAAFPDQDLLRPAIAAARGRAAEIERHLQTPKGRAKMDGHRRDEAARAEAQQRAEETRRRETQRRHEREEAAVQDRRQLASATRPILQRAATDPGVADILDRRLRFWRRLPIEDAALDYDWSSTTDDGSSTFARVRCEIRTMDERRRARAAATPQPEPRPEPGRDGPAPRPSSQQNSELEPRKPDPWSGARGPGF